VFCVLDLLIGSFDYPKHLQIVTGWLHHSIYATICFYLLKIHCTDSFLAFGICEIPTFVLGLGSVYKPYRADYTFGVLFVATRIVYFGCLWLATISETFLVHRIVITLVMGLHTMWLKDWIQSMRRRGIKPEPDGVRLEAQLQLRAPSPFTTEACLMEGGNTPAGDPTDARTARKRTTSEFSTSSR
jgi:hypothetical protein